MLINPNRPGYFHNTSMIYSALQGIVSAVEMLHDCRLARHDDQGLHRIGYHHDIRPENILVDSGTFYLADFGFSRLKDLDEASQTRWKTGLGDYLGPECLDANDLKQQQVGRALDVWTLGCLFYEIAAYIIGGPTGVEKFRRLRRGNAFRSNMEDKYFFSGRTIRPSVVSWARNATESSENSELQHLLRLAGDMLVIDASCRPKTKDIRKALSFMCIQALLDDVLLASKLSSQSADTGKQGSRRSLVSQLHLYRLKAWAKSLGFMGIDPPKGCFDIISDNYERFCKVLIQLRESLQAYESADIHELIEIIVDEGDVLDEEFHASLDVLCQTIHHNLQEKVRNTWLQDCLMLETTRQLKSPSNRYQHSDLEMFTTLRAGKVHLAEDQAEDQDHALQVQKTPSGASFVPFERLSDLRYIREWLAICKYGQDGALVELVPQTEKWRSITTADQEQRMKRKASILCYSSQHEKFLNLECLGYTCIPEADTTYGPILYNSHGFVYAFPAHARLAGVNFAPITLDKIIRTRNLVELPLGERFKLAFKIANSIKELHMVGWVHKNICSRNIIFFEATDLNSHHESLPDILSKPYLIDFRRSRPTRDTTNTETNSSAKSGIVAQYSLHPDYAAGTRLFQESDEYYSLGLLLLEIGSWATLDAFIDKFVEKSGSVKPDAHAFRKMLVDKYVTRLSHLMGGAYSRTVMACLQSSMWKEEPSKGEEESYGLDLEAYQDSIVGTLGELARSPIRVERVKSHFRGRNRFARMPATLWDDLRLDGERVV